MIPAAGPRAARRSGRRLAAAARLGRCGAVGFARGVTGGAPYVPPTQAIAIAAAIVLLVLVAAAAPSRVLLRRAPTTGTE